MIFRTSLFCLVLHIFFSTSCCAQSDTISLVMDNLSSNFHYDKHTTYLPNHAIAIEFTSEAQVKNCAGVGEPCEIVKIFPFTKKKWRGYQPGHYTKNFLVSGKEFDILDHIILQTNNNFPMRTKTHEIIDDELLKWKGRFVVIRIYDKKRIKYNLVDKQVAIIYGRTLLNLIQISGLSSSTKEELVRLLKRYFDELYLL